MKTRLLGIFMIVALFATIFVAISLDKGIMTAIINFGLAALLIIWAVVAVHFLRS